MNLLGAEHEKKINAKKKTAVKIIYRENFPYLVYRSVH